MPHLVPVRLRLLPVDEADALLAGRGAPTYGLGWHQDYPMSETLDALALASGAHRANGWAGATTPHWWLHQVVVADQVVGDAGFHGPPATAGPAEVEIAYHVVPGERGRGIATSACRLLLERAWADGAAVVRAETELDNVASQRVLARVGFRAESAGRFRIDRSGGDR